MNIDELKAENARLKAEVERLRLSAFDKKVAIEAGCYARVNLEAKIERLIKAGDAMADAINGDYNHSLPCIEEWRAAKEGKPSETKSPSFLEDLGNGVEKHDLLFRVPKPPKEGKPSV